MEPFKGAIVNYHCIKGEEYLGCGDDHILPAIITGLVDGPSKSVNLIVFTNQPSSLLTMRSSVAMGMTNGGGWTWPAPKLTNFDATESAVYKDTLKVESVDNKVDSIKAPFESITRPRFITAPKVG